MVSTLLTGMITGWLVGLSPSLSFKFPEDRRRKCFLHSIDTWLSTSVYFSSTFHFLQILTSLGYIGEFEYIDDHRSGKIVIQLNGRLNKCGVISPRYNVKINDIEKWTDNLLPARQFGYVILTTSAGIMDHDEAKRKHVAGKILGFVY
ncbi:hypothetical protein KL905_002777 [Ogataea polymorpha]|nr:hypothetical protein KL937_002335 [Ogataea polymorpha]KAG7888757.1 hypothetical protein KL936_003144 [Ogataea polymorpha]KAG7905052.1 hypothetical protein KL907_003268 [Ogataea polymorpha]KAG7907828.1 hypothetical protein KL906_003245 [Ogataea polymorpha]KAG7916412.1 hypothetical protein KL927_003051 [Ogataea polymorpha]